MATAVAAPSASAVAANIMRATHEDTSGTRMAAQLAQESRLFKLVHEYRHRQHRRILEDVRSAASEAHAAEAKLVSALDFAQFAEDQLQPMAARTSPLNNTVEPGLTSETFSRDWRHSEHKRLLDDAEVRLRKHQELREELAQRRERVALAVAQIRTLRGLCTLVNNGTPRRAQQQDGLTSVLGRCEDGLLAACNRLRIHELATDFEATSLYGLLLPVLKSEALQSASSASVQEDDRFMLPGGTPPRQFSPADEEEAALQRHVEDLSSQRIALRVAVDEAKKRRMQKPTPNPAKVERDIKDVQRQLADAYEHLALMDAAPSEQELKDLRRRLRTAQEARLEALESTGSPTNDDCGESERIALAARHQAEITDLKERLKRSEIVNKLTPDAPIPTKAGRRPSLGLTPLQPRDDPRTISSRSTSKSSVHEPDLAGITAVTLPMPSSVVAAQRLKASEYTALQRHGSAALQRIKAEASKSGVGESHVNDAPP